MTASLEHAGQGGRASLERALTQLEGMLGA